jgi:hypothetical protein
MRLFVGLFVFFAIQTLAAADTNVPDAKNNVIRLSEPVLVTETHEVFGAMPDESGTPVTLQELVRDKDRYMDSEVLVTTRIAKVCQKKGCFFVAQDGDAVARVTFKDYSFFIPTDSAGKQVTLSGTFTQTEISEARAKHYADDLRSGQGSDKSAQGIEGQTDAPAALAGPGLEYQLVATSISIPKQ